MNFLQKAIYTAIGGAAFGAGVYLTAKNLGPKTPEVPQTEILHTEAFGAFIPKEQSKEVHDFLAPKYDKLVATEEAVVGVSKFRTKLGAKAVGSVLEVAVGSGRNLPFYGPSVTRITGVDYSMEMMKQAMTKTCSKPVKFSLGDVHNLQAAVQGERFDTVVDSFGLCSFEDPVLALRQMQSVCKPNGQILLLEHGSSTSKWMRMYMDSKADSHAHSWACIYNRDIDAIVEKSGLIVEHKERKHFGTTYFIVARPSPEHCPPYHEDASNAKL
jgi:methyltransferase OMS1